MGHVYAEIELINSMDAGLASKNIIGLEEIRRYTVKALVDTGAISMCINETIQEQMQFPVVGVRKAQMANDHVIEVPLVSHVEVRFKNRQAFCSAMVLPGDSEVLLGSIPLEEMDVIIHPQRQELIVNPDHPYFAQLKIKISKRA
jgi:clan AA aspartic protease